MWASVWQISQPLTPLVDEFAGRLFGELDYLAEGRSAERFQARSFVRPRTRAQACAFPRDAALCGARRCMPITCISGRRMCPDHVTAALMCPDHVTAARRSCTGTCLALPRPASSGRTPRAAC